jgi:ATP-dependent Clp protease ATP-binding subunit ClpA
MLERFTPEARRTVSIGVELAGELRHGYVGTEHLLIALASTGPNVATGALIVCGFDPARARVDLQRVLGPPPGDLADEDAAALRSIGIDLDEVRRRTEAAFGRGALDRRRRWDGRRRGRVCGTLTPRSKKALQLALRHARRFADPWIGPEHVLLGLLERDMLSVRLLHEQGIDPGRVSEEVARARREGGRRGA